MFLSKIRVKNQIRTLKMGFCVNLRCMPKGTPEFTLKVQFVLIISMQNVWNQNVLIIVSDILVVDVATLWYKVPILYWIFLCLRVPTILQNKRWRKQKKTVTHEFMETETIMSNAKECNDVSTTIADILTTEFYSQTTQIVNFVQ